MVARIRTGTSIKGAINYNEKKVKEGKAELIGARFYHKDLHRMNFHEKLNRLANLAALNTRASTNCLHLSLNFDPSERLSKLKLVEIAEAYMHGIGFSCQPYLIYQHHDAAHEHIHIVSTNIKKDGTRISLHNVGRTVSEKTRKEIEVKFGLVRAGHDAENKIQQLIPVKLEKALYGKVETKRAITNIITGVMNRYLFTSVPEFNAVLQLYRISADRGEEGTRMREKGGLQYCLIDDRGKRIGVPIKASSIYRSPTMKVLASKFETNKELRNQYKVGVKQRVSEAAKNCGSKEAFLKSLKALHIDVCFRTNDQNFLYGVTYIDHVTKTVFNGSELGKELSAAALRSNWAAGNKPETVTIKSTAGPLPSIQQNPAETPVKQQSDLLNIITDPRPSFDYVPYSLKKKRKRKGRNQSQ